MPAPTDCPCGSGQPYADCCGRLHAGRALASTAEELMRSRYSAFAVGDADYLYRTWHPRTRPDVVRLDAAVTWLSLQIVQAEEDIVEFVARYRGPDGHGSLHERSRFARRAGRWFYLDGEVDGS